MNNYDLLYKTQVSLSESSEEDDESQDELDFQEEVPNINNTKYYERINNILISSMDRNWSSNATGTFSFPVKFNASSKSLEEVSVFDRTQNRNIVSNIQYYGSESVSIPIDIRNIKSIHIEKLILPNRQNYLGNGNFNETINFNCILVHIEEFTFTNHGSNDGLNNCFCAMSGSSSFDGSLNYIEFDNLNEEGREFRPSPLNNVSSLTFKFTDDRGNLIRYQNEYLTLKQIKIDTTNSKFIEITTEQYFSRLNYKEGDILYFDDVKINDNSYSNLNTYLNHKNGHRIYFSGSFTSNTNLNTINNLVNVFYIYKKGDFNTTGAYTEDPLVNYPSSPITNLSGNIINKNLQLLMKLKIVSQEKDFTFFNPNII